LLPFTAHCLTKNIGFNNSGYVIQAPLLVSIYGAPPFTGNPVKAIFTAAADITLHTFEAIAFNT